MVGCLKTRELPAKGLCYRVGEGSSVNFWEDPWIPNKADFFPKPINNTVVPVGMVSSLMTSNGDWDADRLNMLFDQESVECIKEMFWATSNEEDKLIWSKTKTGLFSVKSEYALQEEGETIVDNWWKGLWGSCLHERTNFFMWKLANAGLSVSAI